MTDSIPLDDDTAERLRRAKIDDESWSEAVDRLLDVYDSVRAVGYQELGFDPLADHGGDE